MPVSEIEVLRKENSEITDQFRELMSQSRYLVRVVDALKQENSTLMKNIEALKEGKKEIIRENDQLKKEIAVLQEQSTTLALKLNQQGDPGDPGPVEDVQRAVEYLMRRDKTGTRPAYLNRTIETYKPKVCLVSSLPKSGTWANQYFWSVFDSLCRQGDTYDPYDAFFMQLDGIGADVFGVAHFYCPRYRDFMPAEVVRKLDAIKYPAALNFDWGSKYMADVGIDRACDPWENKNVKIALIYRNPLDQMLSYTRVLWDKKKYPGKGPFDNVQDEKGNIIRIDDIKQYIRVAGAASYVYYFMTFYGMKEYMGDRLIFMRYEDITRNRYEKHAELARYFLGTAYNDEMDEKLREALEITRIENMKLLESASGRSVMHGYKAPSKGTAHVHDGSIGQWKKVLDQDDIDFIFNMLDDFGISRDYFVFE